MSEGLFITLEGGEGAGKTTQIRLLAQTLQNRGFQVVQTREPGGTPAGEALRDVFVAHKGKDWPLAAQTMLMFTARALHVETLIRPALEEGKIVISDRFTDLTRAYQGYAQGYDPERLEGVKRAAIGDFEPDLTFIFDIDPREGLVRATGRAQGDDTFEENGLAFHDRLREGYRCIAKENPQRCVLIDATGTVEAIAEKILAEVLKRLDV